MRTRHKLWISPILIIAMMISLLIPFTAGANEGVPNVRITNLHVNAPGVGSNGPEPDNSVPRFTTNPITVVGTIQNISSTQINDLWYTVENTLTGYYAEERNNKAFQTGSEIRFNNVLLTEGLNKITIRLGTGTVFTPGWVYYSSITSITNLMIGDQIFEDNRIYPSHANSLIDTTLLIRGKAMNALEVYGQVHGHPMRLLQQAFDGDFYFTLDDVNSTLPFVEQHISAGDNLVTFTARNHTSTSQIKKYFVYDNGRPFAYNVSLTEDGSTTPRRLVANPTITTPTVALNASFKVNLPVTGAVYNPDLPYMNVVVAGGAEYTYDLTNIAAHPELTLVQHVPNQYNIYEISLDNVALAGNERDQAIQFVFYGVSPTNRPTTTYTFTYEDPNRPYISHAARMMGNSEISLTRPERNEISEMPVDFVIYANTETFKVNAYISGNNDAPVLVGTAAAETPDMRTIDGVNYHRFVITLSEMISGFRNLTFIPSTDSDTDPTLANHVLVQSGEYTAGYREYSLNITSTPYVIAHNFYNGKILQYVTGQACNTGSGILQHCLEGRLVNLPSSEYGNVEVVINESAPMPFVAGDFTILAEGSFRFIYNNGTTRNASLREGRNVITFIINQNDPYYPQYKIPVSIQEYEIFVIDPNVPNILSVNVEEPDDVRRFIPGSTPGSFVTNETHVQFSGQFVNATQIQLTARTFDEQGLEIAKSVRRIIGHADDPIPGSSDSTIIGAPGFGSVNFSNGIFSTLSIRLNPRGETRFEFVVTNASGVQSIRTVSIVREPLPFRVEYPRLSQNDRRESQANINRNYSEIIISAEYADRIVFGKEEVFRSGDGLFRHTVKNLRNGRNVINFNVHQGDQRYPGSFVLFYTNTAVEGAEFMTTIGNTLRAFNNEVVLTFPRGTSLMRNDPLSSNQFINTSRTILFGIADPNDGRVSKETPYQNPDAFATSRLQFNRMNFRPASKLFWIDTGTIQANETNLEAAYLGGGQQPYAGPFYTRTNIADLVVPTQVGQLTLKYDPILVQDAWKYVSVFYFGPMEDAQNPFFSNSTWQNLGGKVDTKNNTITVPFTKPGYYRVMYMHHSFTDVIEHGWARNDIEIVYSKGYMGVRQGSNSFEPQSPMTRGEFAQLLVKIFDIPLNFDNNRTFVDVSPAIGTQTGRLYDYKYIETAARAGIVRGVSGGYFMPENPITREDAAVMIVRAADGRLKLDNNDAKVLKWLQDNFTDVDGPNGINIYAQASVESIAKAGFIRGIENVMLEGQKNPTYRFEPKTPFTREQAAAVAVRVLRWDKKIP